MSSDTERVTGIIPANTRLEFGFEQLQLVITTRRIIVVHKAKRGRGGLASIMVLGGHTGDFMDPDRPKNPLGTGTTSEGLDPNKILGLNKNNFAIDFAEVVSVQVEEARDATTIAMVTSYDKFQFFTKLKSRVVSDLLSGYLGARIVTRKRVG